ncbi:hypothetical protein D9C73_027779 [Collichthys lucidus]|uniref:Uncharacterized protein n=1 Tax=Collichthys lucidus TaxID=240159 RepID=A0A4U5TTX1_COLLU|nr:hypothetical protein D9C73_027779 [Collichthys lucidus]
MKKKKKKKKEEEEEEEEAAAEVDRVSTLMLMHMGARQLSTWGQKQFSHGNLLRTALVIVGLIQFLMVIWLVPGLIITRYAAERSAMLGYVSENMSHVSHSCVLYRHKLRSLSRPGRGAFESLISTSKDLLRNKLSIPSNKHILNANRFKGQLGATITVITSLIVGFLTLPNNILYFIDNKHGVTTSGAGHREPSPSSRPDHEYVYIHAGIALITLGCLAMIVSIVLSYFAAKSKRKMYASEGPRWDAESTKTSRTVMACLIMMNVELFMAVIAGCMELLYRPLISDASRLHNVECTIAVFNIVIYAMYVPTMVLTSTILKAKQESVPADVHRDILEAVTVPVPRDYVGGRSPSPYNSHSSFI